ncbi:MAG TPA: potassium-transporting ATPase subunit KdpC [Polyangia bacterium]
MALLVALRVSLVTLVLTGLAYPLAVTGLGQLLFPARASGSLASDLQGRIVGSERIGQAFTRAYYFHPRPSAAGDQGWDAAASGGSNLGPTSEKLRERIAATRARLELENPDAPRPVPEELLTTSGSGLDPDISPQAARWQVARVAKARGVSAARVRQIVDSLVEDRDLGFLGEPRVDVLMLNLAMDRDLGRELGQAGE